jgi:uncharacterized protein with PIN domain
MAARYVLDASAILAFPDNEARADEVQQRLEATRARQWVIAVCAISLMERAYITERDQGEDEAARLVAWVKA